MKIFLKQKEKVKMGSFHYSHLLMFKNGLKIKTMLIPARSLSHITHFLIQIAASCFITLQLRYYA